LLTRLGPKIELSCDSAIVVAESAATAVVVVVTAAVVVVVVVVAAAAVVAAMTEAQTEAENVLRYPTWKGIYLPFV
jgi:hypothetical protein